ncbi:MAG: DUF3429 domain-containing protein [Pseudomonadota bacterium]
MTDPLSRLMPGVPPAAGWLGLAGLLPFFAGAAAHWVMPGDLVRTVTIGYGLAILSFMGGCRWGFAAAGMGQGPRAGALILSVIPCLFGWLVVLMPGSLPYFGLALGFVTLFFADRELSKDGGAPPWWPALRLPLSVGAAGALVAAGVA